MMNVQEPALCAAEEIEQGAQELSRLCGEVGRLSDEITRRVMLREGAQTVVPLLRKKRLAVEELREKTFRTAEVWRGWTPEDGCDAPMRSRVRDVLRVLRQDMEVVIQREDEINALISKRGFRVR